MSCVCVFLRPSLFPSIWRRTRALSSVCRTDQASFTDVLPTSHLMEELNPNTEPLGINTLRLLSLWNS